LVPFNRMKVLYLVIQSEGFVMKQIEPSGGTRENSGPCPLRKWDTNPRSLIKTTLILLCACDRLHITSRKSSILK
jgi:hypothetical protein